MPEIKYSNNPNSDTVFVVQDGGQKNRAVLTAEPSGTLQLSDSANVSTGYVTGEDGKKHKVNLVAQLEGDIEFSENPNSTKGYATIDGKKHRVVLTASLHGGGGEPINNQDKTITANGSYTADEGYTGLGTVIVNVPNPSTGTKSITSNGVYDVTDFSSADVQVPTSSVIKYGADVRAFLGDVDANGVLQNATETTDLVFAGVKSIAPITSTSSVLFRRFQYLQSIRDVSFPDLENLNTPYALASSFYGSSIRSINMTNYCEAPLSPSHTFENAFYSCKNLEVANLSGIRGLSNSQYSFSNAFNGCSALTTVNLENFELQNGPSYTFNTAFSGCTALRTLNLNGIDRVNSGIYNFQSMLNGCSNVDVYFGSLRQTAANGLYAILAGASDCTLHFPKNLDPQTGSTVVSGLQGYPTFGGTNITLLYDMPSAVILRNSNNISFVRKPSADTANSLGWYSGFTSMGGYPTSYYTSGTSDPQVGDTIYSDAACTQAVTTISSIA